MGGRRIFALGLVLVLGSMLAACGPAATPTVEPTGAPPTVEPTEQTAPTEEPEGPFVLRVGGQGDLIDCLNFASCVHGYYAWELLYDHLWTWDLNSGGVAPELAESWEISDDLMTWTFHLVDLEDATFHDGTPLTAEAIAWSLNYFAGNEALSWWLGTEVGEGFGFEVVDSRTLILHMIEPLTPEAFQSAMGLVPILPQHVWEGFDSETIWDFDNAEAIGSGPYRLVEFIPGQDIIFEAYEGYWQGKPPVDRIVVENFSSQDAMAQALIAGDIDAVFSMPPSLLPGLEGISDLTVYERGSANNDTHILFNRWEGGNRSPAIDDVTVRQAIAHAINKRQIVDVVYAGHAAATNYFLDVHPRYDKWTDPALKGPEFNLDLAASMLEEAGYLDTDGNGVREMNDGSGAPLTLRLYFDVAMGEHFATAQMISDWLSAIGVDAQVQGLEESTMLDSVMGGDFDMMLGTWGMDIDPDIMLMTLTTKGIDWQLNWSGYSNPEYDDLYLEQHHAKDDKERRGTIWKMFEVVDKDVPRIQLNVVMDFDVFRNDHIRFASRDTYMAPFQANTIYSFERVK